MNSPIQPVFEALDATEQAAALAAVAKVAGPVDLPTGNSLEAGAQAPVRWPRRDGYGARGRSERPVQVLQLEKLPDETRAKVDLLAADGYSVRVGTGTGSVEVGAPNGEEPPTRWTPVPDGESFRELVTKATPAVWGAGVIGGVIAALFTSLAIAAGVAVATALITHLLVTWYSSLPPKALRQPVSKYRLTGEDRMAIATATVALAPDSPEVKLSRMAASIAQEIEGSPAWSGEWFVQQRALYSPAAAANAIAEDARKVALVRQNLTKAAQQYESSEVAEPARAAVAQKLAVIDGVHVKVLMERVAAMWSYRRHLGEFEADLERLRHQEQLAGLDEEMVHLNAQLGVGDFEVGQTNARIAEIKAMREQLQEYVRVMDRALAAVPEQGEIAPGNE